MRRLTKRDWEIINNALAAIEASVHEEEEDEFGEDYDDQLQDVRHKVWERLPNLPSRD